MKLKYYRCGDYYFPDLGLTEEEQHPVGKYGQLRMEYLRKNRPGLFTRLLLSGKLMEHLHEIDDTCYERLELMVSQMKQAEGITEALKATDQMEWVRRMNSIHHRAEEIVLSEFIYD